MNEGLFKSFLIFITIAFSIFFLVYFLPSIFSNPDIFAVIKAGFENPFVTGYSIDLIACWVVLIVFVVFEAKNKSVKYGWICVILGLTPGVVVGWSVYLLLRYKQLNSNT